MNNQQPGFAPPESFYGEKRPINTDPREQPGYMPRLNTDPREQPQWQPMPGPVMTPPQQRQDPWRWMGISVVILVVIFGGLFTANALLTHQISATRTFQVGDTPKLVLTSTSGDVHIVNGAPNQIIVVAREQVFVGDNDQIPVQYSLSSDGNTLTVSAEDHSSFNLFGINQSGIDFDVTVPSQTTLDVHADSGDITSSGVNGAMTLTTDNGDVTTDGGSGQISLTSSSGDIHASNVSGQMTLTSSSGDITAINANATASSTFQASSGDITYSGSLAAPGIYTFQDDSGDISLTLPANASFQVTATTDSGDIDSEFPAVLVQNNDDGDSASARGSVGSGPSFAAISMHTSSGDIHLRQD